MTAIVVANNIPSNIATLEALLYHNILAAEATIGNATFNLDNGNYSLQPYVSVSTGKAYDQQLYCNANIYIPLDPQMWSNALNQKPWLYAKTWSTNAYPSAYNS